MSGLVFISYSTRDKAVATKICSALEGDGMRCWMAPRDIQPGANYGEAIVDALQRSFALVLVLSASASLSDQVAREVERASAKGLSLFPFKIEACQPSKTLEYFISTAQWVEALPEPVESHYGVLSKAVRRSRDRTESQPQTTMDDGIPPEPTTLKYYVYVSDLKLRMLLPQVPGGSEVAVADGLGTFPGAGLLPAHSLAAVTRFIRSQALVGTVDEPAEYVQATLEMRWGPYGDPTSPLTYFGGATELTTIGLVGSTLHVLGHQRRDFVHSHSTTQMFFHAVKDMLDLKVDERDEDPMIKAFRPTKSNILKAVQLATRQQRGPLERLEFLAKTLMQGHIEGQFVLKPKRILLATPIYVAHGS